MNSEGEVMEKIKCQFIIPKKKRPCRMWALKGERFCGEHTVLYNAEDASLTDAAPGNRIRVICPLDNSHTCFASKLQKHLKICNARVKEQPPYFAQDINSGDGVAAPGGQTIHQLSDPALVDLLQRIQALYTEHVQEPESAEEAAHPALAASLQDPEYGSDTLKHLRQNSALLAVLRDAGLLDGERTFVELGSGKAKLSFWLARAVARESKIVLVDMASHRHKAENKLKDLQDVPDVQRLKINIQHLRLAGCEACSGRPVVALSKHLCGAATDLGIRCATSAMTAAPAATPESSEPAITASSAATLESPEGAVTAPPAAPAESLEPPADVRGVAIAVCCHHRVDWRSYVGKHFLKDTCGFSPEDFAALKGVAAWATCGTRSWDGGDAADRITADQTGEDRTAGDQTAADQITADQAPSDRTKADEAAADCTTTDQMAADRTATDRTTADQTGENGTAADQTAVDRTAGDQTMMTTEGQTTSSPSEQESDGTAAVSSGGADGAVAADGAQKRPSTDADDADSKRARLDRPGPGSREASAGRYQRLGLTPEYRTAVGFMCKRLLDEGRRRHLTERGFSARLVRYCPASVSPENVLLLATR